MFAKLKNKLSLVFSKSCCFLRNFLRITSPSSAVANPRVKLGLVSFVLLSTFIISAWLIFTPVAHAGGVGDWLLTTFADIFFALASFFIKLTFFVLKFIIEVAGYNGFIDSSAVIVGWVMVRDVTNMFFVVVLLIISFGTILGLERYEYKKLLVKLIMAAVIVNFSRIICGLIIDIAQVIMITFVNGIAATASGNLVNMFQVDQIFKLADGEKAGLGSPSQIFLMGVAALVFGVMMLVTMLTFLFLLMARMTMLWVLIVLSPFAFVLNVLPQTEKYASQWWGEFGGHVVAGPIIAFFLWLSFVTVGSGTAHDEIVANNALDPKNAIGTALEPKEESAGLGEIMSWEKMANFAIAIAMLLAGAKMAQQLGVVGGSAMGKAGELGKKVAMYASGLQAARWGAGKAWQGAKGAGKLAAKGLYHGTNLVPLLHGIHPEQWKRRFGNVKNKFMTGYQERLNRKTSEATKISKMFRTNEKGQYVKEGPKVAGNEKLDAKGNVMKDEKGNVMYKDQVQSGAGDWFTRQATRFLLETTPGYRGFQGEMSADIAETRKATEEQMPHLASGSQLPFGRAKLEAKQKLKELEETGAGIKAGKEARWVERRDEILDVIEGGGDYKTKLRDDFGMDIGDIADAESAVKRRKRSDEGKIQAEKTKEHTSADQANREAKARDLYMKKGVGFGPGREQEEKTAVLKAETSQIEARMTSEKQTKELEAIHELLKEGGVGEQLGIDATAAKAMLEQVSFDAEQAKARKLASARDKILRDGNRPNEANNFDNTLNSQAEERMKRHTGSADYVQSAAKTAAQLERIRKQKEKVAGATTQEEKDAAQAVLDVLQKSRLEMQISNVQTHAATGDGIKGSILKAAGMSLEQSMDLSADQILELQAQDLAELTGEKVAKAANEATLEEALQRSVKRLEELYGEKMASSMLELKRRANEKAAGQGSLARAGLYNVEYDSDGVSKTVLTRVTGANEAGGLEHVQSRRNSGLSGSKITNVSGFAGSMDRNGKGAAVKSKQSKDILVELASGLTGNNLGSVDKYTKADLAAVFENSDDGDLDDLLGRLKEEVNDKKALQGLLKYALQEKGLANADKRKKVEDAIAALSPKESGSKAKESAVPAPVSKNQKRRNRR